VEILEKATPKAQLKNDTIKRNEKTTPKNDIKVWDFEKFQGVTYGEESLMKKGYGTWEKFRNFS
jgi:hypothetical protein